jgi:hypothetical protein
VWRTTWTGRLSVATFGFGAWCGALCTLFALWLLSGLFAPIAPTVRAGLLLVIGVIAVVRDLEWISVPLPQAARQIPREVLQHGPVRGAWQFGFELGTCVRTFMTGSAPYVVAAAVLLLRPEPTEVAIAAAGVALGRTLPVVQAIGADRERLFADMTAAQRTLTVATAVLTLCSFAVLAATALR